MFITTMNAIRRNLLKLVTFLTPTLNAVGQVKNKDDAGRGLRTLFLSTTPDSINAKPSKEYPIVFGVAIDWPIGENTATIVSLLDGSASLYTTSTFGILGGIGHSAVRLAAQEFVKKSNLYVADATPTTSFPYPDKGHARFYFLTYAGVKTLQVAPSQITPGTGKYADLFGLGQAVLNELRIVLEKK